MYENLSLTDLNKLRDLKVQHMERAAARIGNGLSSLEDGMAVIALHSRATVEIDAAIYHKNAELRSLLGIKA